LSIIYDHGHISQLERSVSTSTGYLLITEMNTMMILCLIAISCGNDRVVYLNMYLVKLIILCMYFCMFLPTTSVFLLSLYV